MQLDAQNKHVALDWFEYSLLNLWNDDEILIKCILTPIYEYLQSYTKPHLEKNMLSVIMIESNVEVFRTIVKVSFSWG